MAAKLNSAGNLGSPIDHEFSSCDTVCRVRLSFLELFNRRRYKQSRMPTMVQGGTGVDGVPS